MPCIIFRRTSPNGNVPDNFLGLICGRKNYRLALASRAGRVLKAALRLWTNQRQYPSTAREGVIDDLLSRVLLIDAHMWDLVVCGQTISGFAGRAMGGTRPASHGGP